VTFVGNGGAALRTQRGGLYGASALDVVGALLLTGVGIASLVSNHVAVVPAVTVAVATMPVAWRRRVPVGCALAFVAGVGLSALATDEGIRCGAVYPAGMLVAYSLGLRCRRSSALVGLAAVLGGQLLESVTDARVDISAFPFVGVLTFGVWAAGRFARSRNRVAEELRVRTRALEGQREETARLAVDVEKLRIASDLELVARERVARIGGLADAGERDARAGAGGTHERFALIERFGRETLNELRGLLGVMRSDEPQPLAPMPTLAQIDALLARARAGGRVVEFGIEGDPRPLPAEIEASGYRIFQYLLGSAIAAGNGAPIAVRLRYAPESIVLEVTGDATGDDLRDGLVAARERASVLKGTLTVDYVGPGRRRLRAQLPVPVHA
jgi:signal transduction histidine kinase